MKIIRAEGGTEEHPVDVNKLRISDLWHLAERQENTVDQAAVLEIWYLAHDMCGALQSIANGADITKPIHTK